MSGLLSMEDLEGMPNIHHNLSPFEILSEVVSFLFKKHASSNINNENIEPSSGSNNMLHERTETRVKKKKKQQPLKIVKSEPDKPLKFKIERSTHEEPNHTNHTIEAPSKIHDERLTHEDLIKGGEQKLQNSRKNKSSLRKTDTLKRKVEETLSNEEWIEDMEMKGRKMKNNKRGSQSQPTPSPSLSKEFEEKIIGEYGGTRIIRVIQKFLTETDVSKGHCRVTIPCSQVESFKFLDDEEMTNLRLGRSITVPLIHTPTENGMSLPLLETSLKFGQWDLHKGRNDPQKVSYQYVLKANWNTIVEIDHLREKDHVQIWAFRDLHNKLCMALVKL